MPKLTEIPRRRFEKYLSSIGCEHKRTKGDHIVYSRRDLKRPIIFQADSEIPQHIVRSNLRTLGISTKQFLEDIKKIR